MFRIILATLLLFSNILILNDSIIFRLIPILLFAVIIFDKFVIDKFKIDFFAKPFNLLLFLTIMIIYGILTTKRSDVSNGLLIFKILSLVTFLLAYFPTVLESMKRNDTLKTFLNYCYLPMILYAAVNLILYFLGLQSENREIGSGIVLSYFGITLERVKFFLTNGINGYGVYLGVVFSISLVGYFIIKKHRYYFLLGLVISVISLLLTDSRGPIIYSLLIFIILKVYYSKVYKPKFLWLVPIIGFVGPFITLALLSYLSTTAYGESLSRSSEDLATGNARSLIWTISINEFLTFKTQHIFGYGEFGQYGAGLSQQWGFLFGDSEGSEYMHPHNTYLSIALDYGYVGLLFFTFLQYEILTTIKKYWNQERFVCYILLSNILYFNLVGIGETLFGFYYQNMLYVFFMINIFAFMIVYKYQIKKVKAQV